MSNFPFLEPDQVGQQSALLWSSPLWLVVLAVLVGLIAWGLAWRRRQVDTQRGPKQQGRVVEGAAWALALAVLVLAIAGPVWVTEQERTEPGRMVVLVDGSASLQIRDDDVPRSAGVEPLMEMLQSAGEKYGFGLEVYTFDDQLTPGQPTTYDGRGTDLGAALATIADRYLHQSLAGVVVVTDGIDRGYLRRELMGTASLDAAAGSEAGGVEVPDLPGPLTIYQLGEETEFEDLAIEEVVNPGFAFLRTSMSLRVRVKGEAGQTVPVTLKREGRLVQTKDLTLDDAGQGESLFSVIPREVGRSAWEVSVPVADDDPVPGNNSYSVVVRVVRDRTRVLQVSGSPSYDQKFLRLFLKEDPSVDLVSFFILRTREDFGSGWRSDELSLIAFPYERLFSEDLHSFDLVILQNFNYEPYFDFNADQLLENLARYVKKGGALVMTGGDRSFDLAGYAGTPLADVLPVRLGVTEDLVDETFFRPELTSAGKVHIITRLVGTLDENTEMWSRLPPVDGSNRNAGLAPGSAALLTHPFVRAQGGGALPVLAVREVGRGRSMALTIDASWRWSFSEAAEGRGNQAYLRFWKNALRWLVADPDDRRVVVSPTRENVLLGDEVRVVLSVRDAGFEPVADEVVTVRVRLPDGQEEPFELVTDATGEATLVWPTTMSGAHRVLAQVGVGVAGQAQSVFAVSAREPEFEEMVPDGVFLRSLVASVGDNATFRGPGNLEPPLVSEDSSRQLIERKETSLATMPWVAVWFGLFASLAWVVRRRGGGV